MSQKNSVCSTYVEYPMLIIFVRNNWSVMWYLFPFMPNKAFGNIFVLLITGRNTVGNWKNSKIITGLCAFLKHNSRQIKENKVKSEEIQYINLIQTLTSRLNINE